MKTASGTITLTAGHRFRKGDRVSQNGSHTIVAHAVDGATTSSRVARATVVVR